MWARVICGAQSFHNCGNCKPHVGKGLFLCCIYLGQARRYRYGRRAVLSSARRQTG